MPLATLRQVLDEAAKGGYGVGAFNVNNMEQVQGIVEAAIEENSPVIMQASRGAIAYAGPNFLRHLIMAAAEIEGWVTYSFSAAAETDPSRATARKEESWLRVTAITLRL